MEATMIRRGGDELTVQVFPDTGITRIQTRLLDVTLRGASVRLDEANGTLDLIGDSSEEWAYALLDGTGCLTISSIPHTGEDTAGAGATDGPDGSMPTTTEPQGNGAARGGTEGERDEHPRVTLSGRVGAKPAFRTTRGDTVVCSFPLAVHDDDGTTTWHKVVAFNDRARKLQESLTKGQEIEVVGYLHLRDGKDKAGNPKQIEEIWAAVVKRAHTASDGTPSPRGDAPEGDA
jgi:hypothetical protein